MGMMIRDNIQRLIEAKGWTWYRLSKKSGVPLTVLYSLGERVHGPSVGTLMKIADALGVTVDELLGR